MFKLSDFIPWMVSFKVIIQTTVDLRLTQWIFSIYWIYIQKSSIKYATKTGLQQGLEKGLEKGLEQGLEQGEWKEKLKIIENAIRIGLPMQTIIELTGLDEEQISSLLPKSQPT